MTVKTYQLPLDFEQILNLVRQLPPVEKEQIRQELEKANREQKLNSFLTDFHTEEISLAEITAEVEAVRGEIYAQQHNHV
jgi:predicted DNA-binding protein YlxM (UPF0122 family)